MDHLRDLLMTIGITVVLVVLLYGIFGVGDSMRPGASGFLPITEVVYVPR